MMVAYVLYVYFVMKSARVRWPKRVFVSLGTLVVGLALLHNYTSMLAELAYHVISERLRG
jgi:hypothetical protein